MDKLSASEWQEKIANLPPNLSLNKAAKQLGISTHKSTVMRRLRSANYQYADGRGERGIDPKWGSADWSKKDRELADLFGVTVQRVNAVRKKIGDNKLAKLTTQ